MRFAGLKKRRRWMPMRLWAVIAVFLFAWTQTAVAAHEVAYGSAIHFHDGQICAISLYGDRHDHLQAPSAGTTILSIRTLFIFRPVHASAPRRAVSFAQRARAPPHHSAAA